jgi:putative ABC transport system permease protein
MNFKKLIQKNIRHFARFYKLIAVAVVITVAVIVGSLMVGDSVRNTLVQRVAERLGDTETIVFSQQSFMSQELLETPLFRETSRGILLINGFIAQGNRLIPVFVWGVDDMNIGRGETKINRPLAREMGAQTTGSLALRLPATGLVPSGSLFVTENYTTSMRLRPVGVVEASEGGNVSMRNEHVVPFNIFVNREELAEVLETEGRINLILANEIITSEELNEVWTPEISGLSFASRDEIVNRRIEEDPDYHTIPRMQESAFSSDYQGRRVPSTLYYGGVTFYREDFTEITSDRIFLQQAVSDIIMRDNENPNRLFSYLVNTIEFGGVSIPYSFATAIDRFGGIELAENDIILSDYTANRLRARVGDKVTISYFISHDLRTLEIREKTFRVRNIFPIAFFLIDPSLSTDFPGLSGVDNCADWDSDLPINMDLITDADELYWEMFKNTPKAIISYKAIENEWVNSFGNATAIRVSNEAPDLSALRAEMFGIQVIHPREAGIYAAMHGVDFAGLFLALGFFIIISAMLLMLIPLSEMLYQRRHEIALLQSLGYPRKRISAILWRESAPVVFVSSIIGVIAGLIYTTLIMWLLGTVWRGATHTDGFSVYPNIATIVGGLAVGIVLSLLFLRLAIARNLRFKGSKVQRFKNSRVKKSLVTVFSILSLLIIVLNFIFIRSVPLFVVGAVILVATAALWGDYWVGKRGAAVTKNAFREEKMIWSTLFAGRKQAILSFLTLALGVFIVFSVGLNRQGFGDSTQIRAGTGGFSIWGESSVPIFHSMSTEAGRDRLSLNDLPDDAQVLQFLRLNADEASCFNLNRVNTPSVLGVDINALKESYFQIERGLTGNDRAQVFEAMMTMSSDSVFPALVDATVLQWSLQKNIGDTLFYEDGRGKPVAIQIIGTLTNSIFQGHILLDRRFFAEIWEEKNGSEVFLIRVHDDEIESTKSLLSRALSEYGVRVSTTNERLRQFNIVTDTYLTIFLTLGSLGLLLGIISFVIVIRKNLTMRRREIDLYRTLGFTDSKIERTLYRENLLVPLYAIATGVIGSLISVGISFANTSIWLWLMALVFTLFFVVCVVVFVRKSVGDAMKMG